jgi:hypothetical protein
MKRLPREAAASGVGEQVLLCTSRLRIVAVCIVASFTATFLLCAIVIHAFGYRVILLPPVKGSATIARDLVGRHPERFSHELEQALRRHRSHGASVRR